MNRVTFQTETIPDTPPNPTTVSPATPPPTIKPQVNNNQLPNSPAMSPKSKNSTKKNTLIISLALILGITTGYLAYSTTHASSDTTNTPSTTTPQAADQVVEGKVYGAENADAFKDEAEGVLVKGGIEGEGSHHLLRDGGPSRKVYLTSSVLDLNLFNEHQIKVWGETFQAQKAGWLMDVGRVEVVKLNAEKPFEEDSGNTALEE